MKGTHRRLWLLALMLALGSHAGPVRAGTELDEALRALSREEDPKARIALVKRLRAHDGPRAAATLARLVRTDPAVSVRVEAARALGRSRAPKADELLESLVLHGGPLRARAAVAHALRGRVDVLDALHLRLDRRRYLPVEGVLMVQAFGALQDERSFERLRTMAADKASPLRGAALRALFARTDRRTQALTVLARLLATSHDRETLLTVLDTVDAEADARFKPGAKRLDTWLEPSVRDAAQHLMRRIEARAAAAKAQAGQPAKKGAADDRYAKPEGTPTPDQPTPEPHDRPRYDLVYVMDATGSAYMNMERLRERIEKELALLIELGSSVRVGLVAYRGHRSKILASDYLPLTFDTRRVADWFERLETKGVDSRGAAITRGLHGALDQMDWRVRARRRVRLFADCGASDPRAAKALVALHYGADRTRTGVSYILRTRTSVPSEFREMPPLGGTGVLELMK